MNRQVLMVVVFSLLVSTSRLNAEEKATTGEVTAVETNSITVDDTELSVTKKTKITIDGKASTIDKLKKGQQVEVVFDDDLEVAITIRVGEVAESDEEANAKAIKAMQGDWRCIAGEENGKLQDKSAVKRENRHVTIKGNSLTMERVGATWVGKFEIDASNGSFDWVGKGPQGNLVEWIGIYEVDGDNLKLCFIFQKDDKAKRPKTFKSKPPTDGMAHASYTFKSDND